MPRVFAALCALIVFSSSASAQIIYEPVQYQYQAGTLYYYGGSDPRVHERAAMPSSAAAGWGRTHGYAFVSGNVHTHRAVQNEPDRVYTDALPYRNAAIYGFTPDDARNEAHRSVPTYFRKRDLVAAALVTESGSLVVPAQAQPVRDGYIMIRRLDRDDDDAATRPATRPKVQNPILIIPKRLLDQPLDPQPTAANEQEPAQADS